MSNRLLPLQYRIAVLLRCQRGPLFILALGTLAALALDWDADYFDGAVARLVVAVGVPLALTTVGKDLRKGVAPLWVQKPVDPVRFYLARCAEGALASVVLSVVGMSIITAAALSSGWESVTHPFRPIVTGTLLSLVIASVGFGFSVTLPRIGQLATLTLFGFTLAFEFTVLLDPSATDSPWLPVVRAILLPWTPLLQLRAAAGVEPESLLQPLAWVFGYCAVWIGLGALGVRRAFAGGSWARSN